MIYIFAGPSITRHEILSHLPESTILPPVKAADLLTLISDSSSVRPSHVHIIDGFFYSQPSVRHKEILHLLSQGITVSGCSSMGALRASELDSFGMIGIGRIYEYYSRSHVSSDGDVALSHLPDFPYSPLTIPLINIRLSLSDLVEDSSLSLEQSNSILKDCQSLHFTQRTKKSISTLISVQEFCPDLVHHIVDWKHRDAQLSLQILSDLPSMLRRHQLPAEISTTPGGANSLNYFLDSIHLRDQSNRSSASLDFCSLFDSLCLQSALLFSEKLSISPSVSHVQACEQFLLSLGSSDVRYFPIHDTKVRKDYASMLAKVILLFNAQINHCGLFESSKILEDRRIFDFIFSSHHSSELQTLATSFRIQKSL